MTIQQQSPLTRLICNQAIQSSLEQPATEQPRPHQCKAGGAYLLVRSIAERCSCGLVQNALDVQASDAASILGGLPLGVVEVCCNITVVHIVSAQVR